MPAYNSKADNSEEKYIHVYNKGSNNRELFKDKEDFGAFVGFLKDYLTPTPSQKDLRETFSVNGRAFSGVPHQPKNYFNKVELSAFGLMPDHFHLLLKSNAKGALEKFMRSLSTRYAIFYNKKYFRKGSIYASPYKSAVIENDNALILITRLFHREPLELKSHTGSTSLAFSSYEEFLGIRKTSWVNPTPILSQFEKSSDKMFKGVSTYKDLVEKYILQKNDIFLLEDIKIEKKPDYSENLRGDKMPRKPQERSDVLTPSKLKEESDINKSTEKSVARPTIMFPEFIATSIVVFILLFTFGLRNVLSSRTTIATPSMILPSPVPQVSGISNENQQSHDEETATSTASGSVENNGTRVENINKSLSLDELEEILSDDLLTETPRVVVNIPDDADNVNIREKPSTSSDIVGIALDGETFEFISSDTKWYRVKLENGSEAYISAYYATHEIEAKNP